MKRGKFHIYLVYLVLATSAVTCVSFSRYSTSVCGTVTATVAKPICVLSDSTVTAQPSEPGEEAAEECCFSVSNTDEYGYRTETAMTYTLYIKPGILDAEELTGDSIHFTLWKYEKDTDSWMEVPQDTDSGLGPDGEIGWHIYTGGAFGIDAAETDEYKIEADPTDMADTVSVEFRVNVIAEQIQPE